MSNSFTGKQKENTTQLYWRVENEENFDSYVVQKSYNGSLYNPIGNIKANQSKAYTFSDSIQNLQQSTVYYRLKLLDKDGNYSYSSVVVIKIATKTGFAIYPNPASKGSIHLNFNSNNNHRQTVAITDLLGRPVYAITKPGNTTHFTIPLKTKPGIYLVSVTDMATQQKVMAKVVMQ